MDEERRGQDRCPTCQGPMKEASPGNWRCRNSMCAYNHRGEVCPRCQHKGPNVIGARGDSYEFNCPECMNKWAKAKEAV